MVLELALKNVGNDEEPIWIAWFEPREEEIRQAGTSALKEMIGKIDNADNIALAITPFSLKSGPMITDACDDLGLPLLTLQGSKDLDELKQQVDDDEAIYSYYPVTSPDKPKHMAFGKQNRTHILAAVKRGEGIVIVDDVYSTGNTVKAILEGLKAILGELYESAQIDVVTVAREGVIHNGEEPSAINMEQDLIYDVYIPKVIGDLNAAIKK